MAVALADEVLQDELAVSLARAVAAANKSARKAGIDVGQCAVMIDQETRKGKLIWRISYGPKEFVAQRGGDFIIEVDAVGGHVLRSLKGQ